MNPKKSHNKSKKILKTSKNSQKSHKSQRNLINPKNLSIFQSRTLFFGVICPSFTNILWNDWNRINTSRVKRFRVKITYGFKILQFSSKGYILYSAIFHHLILSKLRQGKNNNNYPCSRIYHPCARTPILSH